MSCDNEPLGEMSGMSYANRIDPAFKDNNLCVVFCADNGFIPCTSVAIQSIIEHSVPEKKYDIIILHSRVDSQNQRLIERMVEAIANFSIRFVNVESYSSGHHFFTENRSTITKEAYYRLFVPWLLGESYKKALYLDGDMLIRQDISPLFDVELGDNLIAAIRDYWGICHCYMPDDPRRSYREQIGITEIDDYIISSTILFNLERIREQYYLNDVIRLIESRQWFQHDQDVINVLCKGKVLFLSPTWGYIRGYGNEIYLPEYLQADLQEVKTDPVILHFGGDDGKPWQNKIILDDKDLEFWEMADRTPFFPALASKIVFPIYKGTILKRLSGSVFDQQDSGNEIDLYYKQVKTPAYFVEYRLIRIEEGILHLEGAVVSFAASLESQIEIRLKVNNESISPELVRREDEYQKNTKTFLYRGEVFRVNIPIKTTTELYKIETYCKTDSFALQHCCQLFGRFFPINDKYQSAYYNHDCWILTSANNHLELRLSGLQSKVRAELAFLKELWKKNGKNERIAIPVRLFYHTFRGTFRKPVWLVSDRLSTADDNGEAFFRYLNEKHRKEVNSYFVINKNCPDYGKIKRWGKVLAANSVKHKLIRLFAEVNISAQTDAVFRSPMDYSSPVKDIISEAKFIFLQHGILFTDASDWLCRKVQQFDGFVTSAYPEYDSIVEGNYGYTRDEVWLSGMPRFDRLENRDEKMITIMPTWRMYLGTGQNHKTGYWAVVSNFSESNYVQFYRELLHHPRLNRRVNELGYSLQFKIHPALAQQTDKFGFCPEVTLVKKNTPYREIYAKSVLVVTDYSSSIVDFAYLRKPVIYCQFDRDQFFSGNHISNEGYFDYEDNGFGEVEYDLEHTVDRIIEYMENGCRLKDKYRERIDKFFAFNDKKNCERVYDHIMTIRQR